jgi:hypothetical protein
LTRASLRGLAGVASAREVGRVLERVGEVPWGDLKTHFGPAEELPEVLRGLLDPDPEARSEALCWLEGLTFCLEEINEATSHVIPFLIELAASPETPDRPPLLLFLARLVGSDRVDPEPDPGAVKSRA